MSEKNLIQLGNGLKVSAGDITAMMGDFYCAYNEKDGKFNPAKGDPGARSRRCGPSRRRTA